MNKNDIISKWLTDVFDQEETQIDDVDFLLAQIGPNSKHILEVACGSGRILVPLAKAGHHVSGIDVDEGMLSKIAAKAAGLRNISWKKKDAISEEWETGFDVVIIAGNLLFNLITDIDYSNAQELIIKKASRSLVTGGYVYIDYGYTFYPEAWFENSEDRVIFEGTDQDGYYGKMILCNGTYCRSSGMVRSNRRFIIQTPDGETLEKETESIKHFATLEQIHTWLESAGFKVVDEYGDYDCNPINEYTSLALIKAIKL